MEGYSGLVVEGTYGGQPAIIKLYGPDDEGLDVCQQEVAAYGALAAVQGRLVPRMLGSGHARAGVWFVALEAVPGVPLSRLNPVPAAAAAAAVAALRELHSAVPGFVHGDIRLPNILFVEGGRDAGGSDGWLGGAPKAGSHCVIVDLGMARLGAAEEDVQAEQGLLERLLGV
ncbi:hypothetical protein MNEG_5034 [Monoraphidium neglectum]|jgi:serine/threonine protein kinase|uniref:Protein kinase domain-containing protein n=1 Tax=Monoraphidium neglectum TaxID=145388 RepID=A0A0D2MIS2_9CHLO|nr:hypothetical protein MNEG_5034 [Monoraphidium neglectum]KIZ02925.1 hypothetical protein MNEG_5034 [Monoraphidium neglectum]|eukprot:XP_013901944.1 hypothetical protein MNEG_5034 [Monoraphidium neglectum]